MIKAKIICDSVNESGNRITTFEVEYPRIIHSELMTHRQFSRNAASSRAIPFDKMLEQLNGVPTRFGAAQKGMSDNGEDYKQPIPLLVRSMWGNFHEGGTMLQPEKVWDIAKGHAIEYSKAFKEAGYHKQIYNRLTEPFQMIKVVITATEYSNFFWLRDDVMADPTIAELARKMKEAYDNSTPELLKAGELHLPYVFSCRYDDEGQKFIVDDEEGTGFFVTTEQAIKVSAARCAAVSYRNEDYTLEKCLQLYDRLVGDDRKHSSALEHQATPMKEEQFYKSGIEYSPCSGNLEIEKINVPDCPYSWEEGVSHVDRQGNLWSGNFCGFLQHRKTIKGECYNENNL